MFEETKEQYSANPNTNPNTNPNPNPNPNPNTNPNTKSKSKLKSNSKLYLSEAKSKLLNYKEEDGTLTFTITKTDVSYVNAIRRTILSDIPIVVFKTSPHSENNSDIIVNTSRLNNEVIKQRLSCIPICISNLNEPFNDYLLEVNVENNTDTIMMVTTEDFKIRNVKTNEYLDSEKLKQIFPPYVADNGMNYYIDFLRLRPKLSDEIPGEKIKLTCKFTIGTAREDSMFNVTGTVSYGCTPDLAKIEEQLGIQQQHWKDNGKNEKEIAFESANWRLLDGKRYAIKNSFDFIIESVGIYENKQLIVKSCGILIKKLEHLMEILEKNELNIIKSDNTLPNSYDIILENEDYTIGNILNYEIYTVFYVDLKMLDYVGFKKLHPHDTDSILRISIIDVTKGISTVKSIVRASIETAIITLVGVMALFPSLL